VPEFRNMLILQLGFAAEDLVPLFTHMPPDLLDAITSTIRVVGALQSQRRCQYLPISAQPTDSEAPAMLKSYDSADFGVTLLDFDVDTMGRASIYANAARCKQVLSLRHYHV
jgi:hypothetical protein